MKSKVLGLFAVGLLAGPMTANAVLISTSAGTYDIDTVTGEFPSLAGQLDDQVWWGNVVLAREFAETLGGLLGFPNSFDDLGPLFSYQDLGGGNSNDCVWISSSSASSCGLTNSGQTLTWAIATAVPEPGTFALIGLGLAGLALSRRRKA